MMKQDLLQIYAESFRDNWKLPALTEYTTGHSLTYGDLARQIARMHIFFESAGVKRGDKVALMGKNNIDWVIVFMATITYGAVIVPVLQDFNARDAQHIINHSDAELLYVSDAIWEQLDYDEMPAVRAVLSIDSRGLLGEKSNSKGKYAKLVKTMHAVFQKRFPKGFGLHDVVYPTLPPESVAEINYTSGTTGFSKGVMLTLNNLCGNVVFGIRSRLHYRGSRALSFLPLAHAYGCAFDMLTPLAVGTHVTLFGKVPTPKLLVKAMAEVRPTLICCVPLVLEKVYKKQLLPVISKPSMRRLLALPIINRHVRVKIRRKLVEAFGGEFEQVIVGGAPLNPEVEQFLYSIDFPFSVGYGMTECGPLISFTPWREFVPGSSGRTLKGIMYSKVLSDNEAVVPGEICVKGENVMKGYYKNSKATAEVLDADGWLHTGDMGTISNAGTIFIKGRNKTMILSASGQNIYPEEIEAKLNNLPYVAESLVLDRSGRLVAMVYPDYEAMDKARLRHDMMPQIMEKVRQELNRQVAPYEQVAEVLLRSEEFEKTPKRSIKRFLYQ